MFGRGPKTRRLTGNCERRLGSPSTVCTPVRLGSLKRVRARKAEAIRNALDFLAMNEQVEEADESSANQLQHDCNILLVDPTGGSWTQEHASSLLEPVKSMPQKRRRPRLEQNVRASKWPLPSDQLADDIQITHYQDEHSRTVLVTERAFVNASPRTAKGERTRGACYSQRPAPCAGAFRHRQRRG